MRLQNVHLVGLLALGVSASASADILNGEFDSGLDDWDTSGPEVSVEGVDPAARLDETLFDFTTLSQEFTIPVGASVTLSFTFAMFTEVDPLLGPVGLDTFLVSLLDPTTFVPLISNPFVDDFFFVEFDGFFEEFTPIEFPAEATAVTGLFPPVVTDPGPPEVIEYGIGGDVTLDITSFAMSDALLEFTLIDGESGLNSHVIVDDVALEVIPVPVPGAALMGLLGMATIGWTRRIRTTPSS